MGNFNELTTTKKGDLGESIVDAYIKSKGIVPYKPDADQPHPFDRLCASADKKNLYIVEVKTKAKRKRYPDTGIDISAFDGYNDIQKKYNIMVFMFFVDEEAGEIYGGLLNEISKKHYVFDSGRHLGYPLRARGIIYFPIELMKPYSRISDIAVNELKNLTTKNRTYLPA